MTETRTYEFTVTGTDEAPNSTTLRDFNQTGTVEAENAGEAIEQINKRLIEWDILSGEHPVTIQIRDVSE